MSDKCDGQISVVQKVVEELFPCNVTEYGDIEVSVNYKAEIWDVEAVSAWCTACGKLGSEDYEKHNISEDWEMV